MSSVLRRDIQSDIDRYRVMEKRQPHILIVSYPAQGHVNPCLRLARLLALQAAGARVTFSTANSAHRLMLASDKAIHDEDDDLFSYIPYSNGFDDGFDPNKHELDHYLTQSKQQGSATLAGIVDDLALRGRPVTCIIYSIFISWAADVAGGRGIPSFLFWIQPAAAFAVYWHYFHGYDQVVAGGNAGQPSSIVKFPGLPAMKNRHLPSFIVANLPDDPNGVVLAGLKDMIGRLDGEIGRPMVLANTANELELAAITSVAEKVDVVGIGPLLDEEAAAGEGSLFEAADERSYMEWLDRQAEGSVVYVSFGSIAMFKKEEMGEIRRGLRESGRPYLWVVRKNNRWEGGAECFEEEEERKGMVVEWCSQRRVLGHRAVGCFVTHCGWNSTLESLLCGVPTVAVPQWSDQPTNAWLMVDAWATGLMAVLREDGVLEATELRRCLEIVMGDSETSREIRKQAECWKEKARRAIADGGSSHRNLKAFVERTILARHLSG